MRLVNLQTLRYPLSIFDVRAENPQVSYPEPMISAPEGYAEVLPSELPVYDKDTEKIEEVAPIQKDGKWYQAWKISALDKETLRKIREAKETSIRKQRDSLLRNSDWTQLADVNLTNKEEWNKYRQYLRDITNQAGFPDNVTWPTQP